MRLTVAAGDRRVEIEIDGHTPNILAKAEEAAARLMTAGPEPEPPPDDELPFGFAVTGDAGRSYQADGDHHAE